MTNLVLVAITNAVLLRVSPDVELLHSTNGTKFVSLGKWSTNYSEVVQVPGTNAGVVIFKTK